jgi:TonB family protein
MWSRLPLVLAISLSMHATEHPGPSKFYIVSQFFSDDGPSFYYRVLDVKSDGPNTLVRYIRVAPINAYCLTGHTVQAKDFRLADRTPAQLVSHGNPCAIDPKMLPAIFDKYKQGGSSFETMSFSVVAECGGSSVAFAIPNDESLNFKKLKSQYPAIARLFDMLSEVTKPLFKDDPFLDRTEEDDLALQRAGAAVVPELESGRFDIDFSGSFGGHFSFRSVLKDYRGPVTKSEVDRRPVPQLLNSQTYRFSHYEPVVYPALALAARVQGNVDLQLTTDPATGEVQDASAISGQALLRSAAVDAARHWRFEGNPANSPTIHATIEFSFRCQPTAK